MQKIAILGGPGAGKSTFAVALGHALGRKVTHLDILFLTPDVRRLHREECDRRLALALQQDSWIIDGGYPWAYPPIIQNCDTLIWLDTNRYLRLLNQMKRHWLREVRVGQYQPDDTARPRMTRYHTLSHAARQQRENASILKPIFEQGPAGKQLIRLRSRGAARRFLDNLPK